MNLKQMMSDRRMISDAQGGAFLVGNGFGGKTKITPSQDEHLNQLFEMVSSSVSVKKPMSVDDLFDENDNGNYELHVWNYFGRPFKKGEPFCSLVSNKNNTDVRLEFREAGGGVQLWLTERRYYGMNDTEKRVF